MSRLVIHQRTQAELGAYLQAPAQAVLLAGPAGVGKSAVARQTAESLLQLSAGDLESYAYKMVIQPEDGKAIGIESVRELERFLSLKVPAQQAINRAVIIEDAHLLTPEAQNALLKTLEEPPAGTVIVLTANHEHTLLPTINSRLQTMTVRRPTQTELQAYFKQQGFEEADIKQAYAMSGGLPGLMQALLSQDDHPLREAAQQARQLLGQSTFERLATVDSLAKQRELAVDTVSILQQMAHLSLQSAQGKAAERWQRVLRASYDAADAMRSSVQFKLTLTDMVLRF